MNGPGERSDENAGQHRRFDRQALLEQTAIDDAQSPTIDPTEMSISPVMMISVIGSATIATGIMPASAIEMFDDVRKYCETSSAADERRDENEEEENLPSRRARVGAGSCLASGRLRASEQSLLPSSRALDPLGSSRQAAVEEHRDEDRRADHGLEPELVDAEQLHAVLQHGEDHRADRRAVDRCRCRRRC